ncbi:MAG: hypothetical protein R3C15_21520 [Thermoleophilia bacterium]
MDGDRVRDRRERLFDDLARGLASELPRRRVLLLALGAVVGASLPGRALAGTRRPQRIECGAPYTECGALSPLVVPGCCGPDSICCQFDYDFHCCDPKRHRCGQNRIGAEYCDCLYPCGDPRNCCYPNDDCVDGRLCKEKCPKGSVRCGEYHDCCPVGARCVKGECACPDTRDPCKGVCCKKGEECIRGVCKPYCENETARGASRVYDPATQCCTEYGIEPKYPIRYFERCRKTRVPREGYVPEANGCGPKGGPKFPDKVGRADFRPACDAHDICYGTCRSDRDACDAQFARQLKRACQRAYPKGKKRQACLARAKDYVDGVTALGSIAYDAAQSEACQCCP